MRRGLVDANIASLSDESRFDIAYKALMQCALVALLAEGFRPSTSEPGHHQTMLQSLPLTLGLGNHDWVVLDAMRRQRNANDYTGQAITAKAVKECIAQAQLLERLLLKQLRARHPELLAA